VTGKGEKTRYLRLHPGTNALIHDYLETIMQLPPESRCLGELRAFFDAEPEGAGVRLEKWCAGNELGWVLDAPADTVRFGQLSAFDTTALLDNERARGPALSYLYHRISLWLDGTPVLIPCDEGWRALIGLVVTFVSKVPLRKASWFKALRAASYCNQLKYQ